MSDSVRPHRRQPTRLLRPWDSPGKNTGVGCHFLLQCRKVKSLSCVRLFATPWTAAYQSPPSMGFSGQEYWSGVPLPSPLSLLFSIYSWKCVFGRFFPNGVVWRHLVVVIQYSISLLVNQIPLLSTVRQERQDCSVASSSLKNASIASIMRICSPKIKHITSYDKLPFVKHKIFHFYELNF